MRAVSLNSKGFAKLIGRNFQLTKNDLEVQGHFTPGEWIFFSYESNSWLGFINLSSNVSVIANILCKINREKTKLPDNYVEKIIEHLIEKSIEKRERLLRQKQNCRLVYGHADNLPGLVVDCYQNSLVVQINTAGLDLYRQLIKNIFQREYPLLEVILWDNVKYRTAESLPQYPLEYVTKNFEIIDNGLVYTIPTQRAQKLGYYFDHRRNRESLSRNLNQLKLEKKLGLDLFCYTGAWGMHCLKSGTQQVDFVDQAALGEVISHNLSLNGFKDRGDFFCADVFKFLDQQIVSGKKYQVVCSDPPPFAKSKDTARQAIVGYKKLHGKIMQIIDESAVVVFASCTHYVSLEEFEKTIWESALKNHKKITLLDIGAQDVDHPFSSLNDKQCYIKSLIYYVETI